MGCLGVQGVEGDHGVGQVEVDEHRPEDGDLVGLGADLTLGCDQAGPGHRGQKVDLGAVDAARAANGLAVHGQRAAGASAQVMVGWRAVGVAGGEPGADRRVEGVAVHALQDSAHGGFGRGGGPGGFAARAAEGGEHGGRGVGCPFRDRGQGFRAGQYRARGECEDEGEGVAAPLGPTWIGNGREAVQQLRVFPGLGRAAGGEPAQAGGDGR